MQKLYLFVALILSAWVTNILAATEQIILTTYYPAPYGVYKNMDVWGRLYLKPITQQSDIDNIDNPQQGMLITDGTDPDNIQIKEYDGTDWVPLRGEDRAIYAHAESGGPITLLNTVGNFVWYDPLSCIISVKAGQILIVHLEGIWHMGPSSSFATAYPDLFSGNAILISGVTSIRYYDSTSSSRFPAGTHRIFKATADGDLTFKMKYAVEGGAETTAENVALRAWVIGRE